MIFQVHRQWDRFQPKVTFLEALNYKSEGGPIRDDAAVEFLHQQEVGLNGLQDSFQLYHSIYPLKHRGIQSKETGLT